MKSKTFIKASLSIFLILLISVAGFQIAVDPLFQYHTPWFGMEPVITNERYQNAGYARHFDFDNVIMGSSMSENFRVSDVEDLFGGKTAKLTMMGSSFLDWTYLLNVLQNREKQPEHILNNLDPYVFKASSKKTWKELPTFLYDDDYLNDAEYLWNFQIINDFTYTSIESNIKDEIPDYDTVFTWDQRFSFGKDEVLGAYKRPKRTKKARNNEAYLKNLSNNISLIEPYFDSMADTEFVFYFSPFSMAYWDSIVRINTLDRQKESYLMVCKRLLEYDNVKLYFWSDDEMMSIISDLDHYKDISHYGPEVSKEIIDRIKKNQGLLTKDNYVNEIETFFDYVKKFNYKSLFVKN